MYFFISLLLTFCKQHMGFPGGSVVKKKKNHLLMQEMQVWSLYWEDPLEEEMATCSNILAWEIPWTEDPGRIQSTRFQS